MERTTSRTIKIDCFSDKFKDTEMSLFKLEFPVIKDLYREYEIHVIDTGETFRYRLSEDFNHMYVVTD